MKVGRPAIACLGGLPRHRFKSWRSFKFGELGCSVSQDALTVSAPDISQDFAERRNEESRRGVTVDGRLVAGSAVDDQRHNALGKRINRGGTPAVTIDAVLGGGHV